MSNVLLDGYDQFGHAGEHATAQLVLVDVAKEALDHVQPRRVNHREMRDEPWAPVQPCLRDGMLVRVVVSAIKCKVLPLGISRLISSGT